MELRLYITRADAAEFFPAFHLPIKKTEGLIRYSIACSKTSLRIVEWAK